SAGDRSRFPRGSAAGTEQDRNQRHSGPDRRPLHSVPAPPIDTATNLESVSSGGAYCRGSYKRRQALFDGFYARKRKSPAFRQGSIVQSSELRTTGSG